jgi:benzoyl-CoA reductase/2-hydroxyglutaryl-CoA dehydratase subunit BcrC/BadD/HgdB
MKKRRYKVDAELLKKSNIAMNHNNEITTIITKARSIAEHTQKHKTNPIMGFFCSYIPEEILYAAGFMPYRLNALNSTGTTQGDIYYSHLNCTYARHCFDKAMQGKFNFLDGIIFINACDHLRRMYDNWRDADIQPAFRHMFFVPHVMTNASIIYFIKELHKLSHAIESNFHCTITDQKLIEAIVLYQEKRTLLQKIYHERLHSPGCINASDMLTIMLMITIIPVHKAIEILHQILNYVKKFNTNMSDKHRQIFLASSCIEDVDHVKTIESCGITIVTDNYCLGYHYFDNIISKQSDPYQSLAERYLTRVSCPRMMKDFPRRWAFFIDKWNQGLVEGIIVERLKFCDLWGAEMFMFRNECQINQIPILCIERELYADDSGQIKTRVQAFEEYLRNVRKINDYIKK